MAKQVDKTEDEIVSEGPAPAGHVYYGRGPRHSGWLYGIGAVIILILVFMAGAGVARHRSVSVGGPFNKRTGVFSFNSRPVGGGFGGRFGGFGNNSTVNGQTRDSGVVTAVNGSGFTLAGDGSTTNVTTSSSTQYQNGDSVKVDDSVIVIGTTSSGTLSASQIVINP